MSDHLKQLISLPELAAVETDNSVMVEAIEARAGLRFPPLFRTLLIGFEFEPFILGDIEFFGTTLSEEGGHIAATPFKDKTLSPALLQAKLLQIGWSDSYWYDPICFNLAGSAKEPELVRVSHESVLSFNNLKIAQVIAPSFPAFIEALLANNSFKADSLRLPP
jgi:hypothetical protein